MDSTILTTKILAPFHRSTVIVRQRLLDMMDRGLKRKMILVCAPAGYGKTMLVSNWVSVSNINAAWFSLDANDNQLSRFLYYLISALRHINGSFGNEALNMLSANSEAPSEMILTALINDFSSIGSEITLVLEDYHHINENSINHAVNFLIEHTPGNFHLIIISRSDPLLPLSKLRASQMLLEIRQAHLQFSEEESGQFFTKAMNIAIDKSLVSKVKERTQGWVAGMQMAALSMQNLKDCEGFIRDFSGSNRYIMDYLFEQVFINQPLEIQKFLMFTSILERFSAGLCDAVMACGENDYFPRNEKFEKTKWVGLSRTVDIISYLETHNLFFNILGQDRSWFCYHDLFAEMLQTRLQEDYPKSISDLHLCAAKWLIDNDFFIDAVHHLISGGFMDKAIALVAKVLPIQLAKKDLTLIQIADSLPLDLVATEPRLCLYLIWHNVIHGEIKKTRDLLSRLTANIPNTNGFAGNEWITAFVTCVEAFLSPIAESDLSFTLPKYDFFENIPEEDLVLREAAEYFYAMALGRHGKINAAVDVSIRSIQNSHPHRHPSQAPTLAPFLSRVYLMQGFLNKTFTLCQEFLPTLENDNQSIYYTSGSMRIDLGEVFYHRNELDKAESYIRDGLRVNKLWQNVMTEGFGLAALTRVLLSKGEISQAKECIDAFNRNYPSRNSPRELLDDILTLELTFLLASGELNKAIEWADQIKHRLDFQENKSIYQIAIARVRLNEKRYDCVENLLAEIDYRVGSGNIVAKNIEVELMRALAGFLAGEKLKAFFHLDQCLAIAEPEGYVRIFLNFALVVNNLLLEYIGQRGKAANLFAKEVLAALSPQSNSKSQIIQVSLLDPLTNREIEVLQHIAAGLTNREVAGVLVISPGTVKAHTSSIYRKLGATNRTEAVNLAREIGILRQ